MKRPNDDQTETQNAQDSQETLVRFTLDLPEDLHREFKMAAVSEGRSMRSLALDWVRAGVDRINDTVKKR